MFKNLSATSPIITLGSEQAGPRIISLVGCDGSVCWIRWYTAGIDEHYNGNNQQFNMHISTIIYSQHPFRNDNYSWSTLSYGV